MATDIDDAPQGPSAEDIETALNRTGFLLEHRIARSLRKHRYNPEVTAPDVYPDPETGKSREIDVHAEFYEFIEREPNVSVQACVSLVVECKNSSGPFVLIGDHGEESPFERALSTVSFDPFSLGFANESYARIGRKLDLESLPGLPTRADFTGRQLLRLNRQGGNWKADNDAIYDSILYPLAKAWKYKREAIEREKKISPNEFWQIPTIRYIFPVVVTSGQLYTVDATDDNLDINRAKWASVKRTFESKEIKGDLWADVVPIGSWSEYLDAKIVRTFSGLKDVLAKNIHFYDPEWMRTNLGPPSDEAFFSKWLKHHQDTRKAKQSTSERKV